MQHFSKRVVSAFAATNKFERNLKLFLEVTNTPSLTSKHMKSTVSFRNTFIFTEEEMSM